MTVSVNSANAEVISIGTEILLGELTDTNSVFLARMLRDLGINVYFMTSVGDNETRIAQALEIALSRAEVVITCGGLGPTVDDMTRQAVAQALHRDLIFHNELLDQIAERFKKFQVSMTANNRRQAFLPAGAEVIQNPVGTAPAFLVEHDHKVVISLPGVPREMKYLATERVVPYLRQRYQRSIIKARILKSAGIGESAIDSILGDELLNQANPSIGLAAHSGQIDIRITAKAATANEADALIAATEAQVRARVGEYVYGVDADTLEDVLRKALAQRSARLIIIEAGTQVHIAEAINTPSSDALAISLSFDTPSDLAQHLELPVSTPLRELAETAATFFSLQTEGIAAAIVVVTQPDVDEEDDLTDNTVIAVYAEGHSRIRGFGFGGLSEMVSSWALSWSLASVWRLMHYHEANQ